MPDGSGGPLDPRLIDVAASHRIEIERELGMRSLYWFFRMAWPHIDPNRFIDNWHIALLCKELQEAACRRVRNLVINIPPRHGKPVHVDAVVLERGRGHIRLGDVRVGDEVLTHLGRFRRVQSVHEQGVLPTLVVETDSGRRLRLAPDHPVLTTRGWVEAGDLVVGDIAALVRPQEAAGRQSMPAAEARLLGYLIGDGSLTQRAISLTNADPETLADMEACVAAMGWTCARKPKSGNRGVVLRLRHGVPYGGKGHTNPIHEWLRRHGLWPADSYNKRVPPALFAADEATIAEFLGAYWACDGWISPRRVDGGWQVAASTVSQGLARDIQRLLLRLGIVARVRRKQSKAISRKQDGLYVSWTIELVGHEEAARFAAAVPVRHSARAARLACLRRRDFDRVLHPDRIVRIEPGAPGECRCLTVEDDHSFVAEDLAVHNSLLVSVAFIAWVWTWWPWARFITASYDIRLATRDAVATRRLVQSRWYQERWGHTTQIAPDQDQKTFYQTTAGGHRFVTSPSSGVTGHGADFILGDDPHNVVQAESEADRTTVRTFWFEAIPSRLDRPDDGVKIVIQQRVHELDLSGECIRRGYKPIVLPAIAEEDHPHRHPEDPREPGEPLWPARMSLETVRALAREMGSYAAAGQLQQRPVPREGGLFKRHWFQVHKAAPAEAHHSAVRAWDLAGTAPATGAEPDWTVGVKIGRDAMGRFWVLDVQRFRASPLEVEQAIRAMASVDGAQCRIRIPEDPGQAGKMQAQYLVSRLAGYSVVAVRETGDKATRAAPVAAQAEAGNIHLVDGPWVQDFLDELCAFPNGRFDDQVDALSGGFGLLTQGGGGMLDFLQRQLADRDAAWAPSTERVERVRLGSPPTPPSL